MRNFVIQVGINAVALWIAGWILPGMHIAASSSAGTETTFNTILAYLFVGLIFGVVNALVKPIVKLLSLPVTILTLGLFTIVINAAMLWLTAWLSTYSPVQFTIDEFFWTAILAALIISLVSMLAGGLTKTADRS
ncbi:phage holin family protein [Arthrobacter sp. TMN-49]